MNQTETMENQENKYFVPQIEDIRVGYECQVQSIENAQWGNFTITEKWMWDGTTIFEYLELGNVRVPHLTKEQIISERWTMFKAEFDNAEKNGRFGYNKGNYFLVHDSKNNRIELIYKDPSIEQESNWGVSRSPEHFRFQCECKDINTFRHICKLLKI